MLFQPNQRFGPYILIEQIASGGMAEIYLARSAHVAGVEKYCVLKVIHPNFANDEQFIEMLIDEAKISVSLIHPNIVQIFDLGKVDETYFIAMEYIEGADLFKLMRRLSQKDHDVPIEIAALIAHEICSGLAYAHRKTDPNGRPLNIIHRDVSPQNILITKAGEVKIVDFGIAKAASRNRQTKAGIIKGKYYYMSPEHASARRVDQRSDIFSTGIILYEVITGQMLYLEEDVAKLLDMVRRADIPQPSSRRTDVPPALEKIVMRALEKQPSKRWQTAGQFQAALSEFLQGSGYDVSRRKLAQLVALALDQDHAESPTNRREAAVRESNLNTRQIEIQSLMGRDDAPIDEHSVIFNMDELPYAPTSSHRIESEQTRVATSAEPLDEQPPGATQGDLEMSSSYGETWELDNDPTRISSVVTLHPSEEPIPPQDTGETQELSSSDEFNAFQPTDAIRPSRDQAESTVAVSPSMVIDFAAKTDTQSSKNDSTNWQQGSESQHSDHQITGRLPTPQREPEVSAEHTTGLYSSTPQIAEDAQTPPAPAQHNQQTHAEPIDLTSQLEREKRTSLRTASIAAALTALTALAVIIFFRLSDTSNKTRLEVVSVPAGADVTVNGRPIPLKTPLAIDVADPEKPKRISVSLRNYQRWSTVTTFAPGQKKRRIVVALTPLFGRLEIHSEPQGAEIFINDELRGTTPAVIDHLPLTKAIYFELRKPGFATASRTIEWSESKSRRIDVTLRAPAPRQAITN